MEKVKKQRTKLTPKEKAFCEEYVANGYNATQAYMKAYNSPHDDANSNYRRVIKRPLVVEYITQLQKEAYQAVCISAERVALKLADIAFAEKDDEVYNVQAQLKALDLIQKQLGLQKQQIEANVSTDIVINIE